MLGRAPGPCLAIALSQAAACSHPARGSVPTWALRGLHQILLLYRGRRAALHLALPLSLLLPLLWLL
jgi:hypothetical protein